MTELLGRPSSSDTGHSRAEPAGKPASLWGDAWRDLRRNPVFIISSLVILVMTLMAVFPRLFTNADPHHCLLSRSKQPPPSWNPFAEPNVFTEGHPFGFDVQGCDYYAQVVYGARASIVIGLTVTVCAVVVAIVLGSLAGYFGGFVDTLIARVTDVFFGLPLILGAMVILIAFPSRSLWTVSLVLIILGWCVMTRLMRSSVIAAKNMDYVSAARALGASDVRIMRRHILPNAVAPMLVYATLHIGTVVTAEATLTYLGVGLQYPDVSWGLQLNVAQDYFIDYPHLLLFPSLFLSLTVLSFILLGDAIRDALDPKLR